MDEQRKHEEVLRLVMCILLGIEQNVSDEALGLLLDQFDDSVPYPDASALFFWPNLCGFELQTELSAEEITNIALTQQRVMS